MSRNLFPALGALLALGILMAAPFAGLAEAQGTVMGTHTPLFPDAPVGVPYEVNVIDYLPDVIPVQNKDHTYTPAELLTRSDVRAVYLEVANPATWLDSDGTYLHFGQDMPKLPMDSEGIWVRGTPPTMGTYQARVQIIVDRGAEKDILTVAPGYSALTATINVVEPPTPYTVTLISDPAPTSISTSAGTVTLTNGVGTILGGTIMQAPDLQRERQILHRWTDAAGNIYDWSKPVSSDLTLTADWREHYSVAIDGNKATVTLAPGLPTEYTTHQINWGDNTVNSELTHLYAATGDYTITVSSGQWGTWVSSSTTVSVETVTVPTYTVTFNPAGGSVVPGQTVESGHLATEPAAPTRDGYNFTGWLKDGQRYDFSTPVTGNLYLSAGWEAVAPGGDDKDKDEEQGHDLLLIALAVLSLISLAITLLTRSPYAIALTIILALVELALLALGISGVIA